MLPINKLDVFLSILPIWLFGSRESSFLLSGFLFSQNIAFRGIFAIAIWWPFFLNRAKIPKFVPFLCHFYHWSGLARNFESTGCSVIRLSVMIKTHPKESPINTLKNNLYVCSSPTRKILIKKNESNILHFPQESDYFASALKIIKNLKKVSHYTNFLKPQTLFNW